MWNDKIKDKLNSLKSEVESEVDSIITIMNNTPEKIILADLLKAMVEVDMQYKEFCEGCDDQWDEDAYNNSVSMEFYIEAESWHRISKELRKLNLPYYSDTPREKSQKKSDGMNLALKAMDKKITSFLDDFRIVNTEVNTKLLLLPSEINLWNVYLIAELKIKKYLIEENFPAIHKEIFNLLPFVNSFFDDIMEICEEDSQRENGIKMIYAVKGLYKNLFNFSNII